LEQKKCDLDELFDLMVDLSERCYCAGWMENWESTIWKLVCAEHKDVDVGQDEIKAWELIRLKQLIEKNNGIWAFVGNLNKEPAWYCGFCFIKLAEWKEYYDKTFS